MLKPKLEFDANFTPQQIEEALRDSCEGVRADYEYQKPLTPAELDERREMKVAADITIDKLEKEKKEYLDQMKQQMEPLKDKSATLLKVVRDRFETVIGNAYIFRDDETGYIGYYDANGNLINQRRMTPEEKQGSILSNIHVSGTTH